MAGTQAAVNGNATSSTQHTTTISSDIVNGTTHRPNGIANMSTSQPVSDTWLAGKKIDPALLKPLDSAFDSIPDVIDAFANGEFVIVLDSPDRENEGDLIIAASALTTEKAAFLIRYSSGYICAPMRPQRCAELDLEQMVTNNQDPNRTAYAITVDANHPDVTTGISAHDRALTCRQLANPECKPGDLRRPGHVVPLQARPGGVRERKGHTEAAVDLCLLARKPLVGVICEIVRDGEPVQGKAEFRNSGMMRRDECLAFGKQYGIKVCTIEDLCRFLEAVDVEGPNTSAGEVALSVAEIMKHVPVGLGRATSALRVFMAHVSSVGPAFNTITERGIKRIPVARFRKFLRAAACDIPVHAHFTAHHHLFDPEWIEADPIIPEEEKETQFDPILDAFTWEIFKLNEYERLSKTNPAIPRPEYEPGALTWPYITQSQAFVLMQRDGHGMPFLKRSSTGQLLVPANWLIMRELFEMDCVLESNIQNHPRYQCLTFELAKQTAWEFCRKSMAGSGCECPEPVKEPLSTWLDIDCDEAFRIARFSKDCWIPSLSRNADGSLCRDLGPYGFKEVSKEDLYRFWEGGPKPRQWIGASLYAHMDGPGAGSRKGKQPMSDSGTHSDSARRLMPPPPPPRLPSLQALRARSRSRSRSRTPIPIPNPTGRRRRSRSPRANTLPSGPYQRDYGGSSFASSSSSRAGRGRSSSSAASGDPPPLTEDGVSKYVKISKKEKEVERGRDKAPK